MSPKNKKLLVIGVSIVVLLTIVCCLCTGAALWASSTNSDNKKSSSTSDLTPTTKVTATPENKKYDRQEMPESDIKKYNVKRLSDLNTEGLSLEELDQLIAEYIESYDWDFYPEHNSTPTNTPTGTTKTPTPSITNKPSVTPTSKVTTSKNFFDYVTPNDSAVKTVASGKSEQQIYTISQSWVWMSDDDLNGVSEKWLSPNEFLTKTPTYPRNPLKGKIASDCEEHAFTLVSALRAKGISEKNVRVALGKVDFDGSISGHAWVQRYDESTGEWFELEPSSGNAYEDGQFTEQEGLPYDYFKEIRYPSVSELLYFNDTFILDNTTGKSNGAPSYW